MRIKADPKTSTQRREGHPDNIRAINVFHRWQYESPLRRHLIVASRGWPVPVSNETYRHFLDIGVISAHALYGGSSLQKDRQKDRHTDGLSIQISPVVDTLGLRL